MSANPYDGYFRTERGLRFDDKALASGCRWFRSHWDVLSPLVTLPPQPRVLEVGSGLGTLVDFLPPGTRYTGLELDGEAAAFARSRFPAAEFLEVRIEDFEGPVATFDAIFATEVLEHLENPSEALRRIHRLLKPGGYFAGTTPPPVRSALTDPTHLSVLAPENWRRLFTRAGLEVSFTGVRTFVPALWRLHPALNRSVPYTIPIPLVVVTMFFSCRKPEGAIWEGGSR